MNLGIFRKAVLGQIREVVEDIDASTRALGREGLAGAHGTWTPEEQARLRALTALP